MASPRLTVTGSAPADGDATSSSDSRPTTTDLRSPDQLERWADLVAQGEVPFPQGLAIADQERLLHEVQRRRRAGLIRFVARAIAQDVLRTRGL